jgi:cytochrome oxidase Cu insertion factor (SCO1/SenC/PrrC family)
MIARSILAAGVVALAVATAPGQQPKTQPKTPPKREQGNLKVGDKAPPFELADADGKNTIKLADLKGKPVVLVFGSCT